MPYSNHLVVALRSEDNFDTDNEAMSCNFSQVLEGDEGYRK